MTPHLGSRLKCYVASPYGFAESTRQFYYHTLLPLISKYAIVHDPWSEAGEGVETGSPLSEHLEHLYALGLRHYKVIAEEIDLMVACLDQEPPDNGTVAEMAFAAARGIPILGYRGDLRGSQNGALQYNLMIGSAIRLSGGAEVSSLQALETVLSRYRDTLGGVGEIQ